MDTLEEIIANSRSLEAADTRCYDCNDWLSDHPRCSSCGKVRVCSGLCARCASLNEDACAVWALGIEAILLGMKYGRILADEAGERLSEIGYRLSTWDVLPNPTTAAGIEDAEARANAAVPEGLRAA